MSTRSELTDLLPRARRAALTRDYYLRLGVVAAFVISAFAVAAGLLLLPTYVFLSQSESAKLVRLASVEATLASTGDSELSARLATLMADATTLAELAHAPSPSAVLREMLSIKRQGISLSGITYTGAAGKNVGTLAITGTAATRDALRNYQIALQASPFAAAVTLPVSAYAKDTDIAFTVTVTLKPL